MGGCKNPLRLVRPRPRRQNSTSSSVQSQVVKVAEELQVLLCRTTTLPQKQFIHLTYPLLLYVLM